MLVIAYCAACFDELEQYGEAAKLHYVDVCEAFIKNPHPLQFSDICHCCDGVCTMTKFLEQKDFVVSTDIGDSLIRVIPSGHKKLENGLYLICPGKCERFDINESF